MSKILFIALKDVRILTRDKASLFWVMFFPLLIALFFGTIFSGSGGQVSGMRIAAINEDGSDYAAAFIDEIDAMEALRVSRMPRDSAVSLVRRGKLSAMVVLKKGFGDSYGMFTDSALLEIGIDPARRMEAGYLQGLLTRANFMLLHKTFATLGAWQDQFDKLESDSAMWASMEPGTKEMGRKLLGTVRELTDTVAVEYGLAPGDSAGADSTASGSHGFDIFPVEVNTITNKEMGPRSAFEITFPSALLWALIGISATFAVSIVKERKTGTYTRLRLAPVTRAHILAGKGLAAFLASVSICVILLLIGNLIFGVRITNPGILALGVASAALCFVGLTMLVSVIGRTEEAVGGASWGIFLVAAMTGGGMIPVMFMPNWLLTISHASPVKWGILAIEGGIWRSFTLAEMLLPVSMLLGIGAVAFAIGVIIMSRFDC